MNHGQSGLGPSSNHAYSAGTAASGSRPALEHLHSHFSHIAPGLTAHLADREANSILSTAANPSGDHFRELSNAFVSAYETAARMGLGVPLRVTLSTTESGLVALQSAPASAAQVEAAAAAAAAATAAAMAAGATDAHARARSPTGSVVMGQQDGVTGPGVVAGPDTSKMLVGTVVAPAGELAEARVAVWAIEDVARRLQTNLEK